MIEYVSAPDNNNIELFQTNMDSLNSSRLGGGGG